MENRLYPTWAQLEQQHNPLTPGAIKFNLTHDNHI